MATNYTTTLTNSEKKAMEYVAFSVQDWIDNAVRVRCSISIEEIVAAEVQRKLAAGESITGSKDDIVMAATIESAEDRNKRLATEKV